MRPHLQFKTYMGRHLHLGVTGSVAAYKSLDILRALLRNNVHVSATVTPSAAKFVTPMSFEALGAAPVYTDMFEDKSDSIFGHLEPGQNAHAMLIAPASADILARMTYGLADNILACQALAFDGPIVVAPAMNPRMWAAQATQENVAKLKERGVTFVLPECGEVACGDTGTGKLAPLEDIQAHAMKALTPQDMQGKKVLITLGPTQEMYDAVRFWSNPSSGLMGACVAVAAWLRGAEVHVVHGPVSSNLSWFPSGISTYAVQSAHDMYEQCMGLWDGMDIGCFTAAVADFRPAEQIAGKMTKSGKEDGLTVKFAPNKDILKTIGQSKKEGQKLIGFAAQTSDLATAAKAKLDRKNLDLIVANRIDHEGSGFGVNTNAVLVLDRLGRMEEWPQLDKTEVAWRIWDHLLNL
ncbi:MAG: bifunctional phosphopantothenoylcysteine decarboxylase/phosphopantothenate--cysteine ligase CoaBC [Desulfovibrio sp.]